jgi:glutaconyl-CoA/methylmalonyl-CoA decarboxylase subunit gamma
MGRTFTLSIDDKEYSIEQLPGAILVDGKRYEPRIIEDAVTVGSVRHTVELDGDRAYVDGIARTITTEGLDERSEVDGLLPPAGLDGEGNITAIMPGLIIRVVAAPGGEVKTGDVVVVLEAMKMENDICSPKDGMVKEIRVKAGDSVQQNQVLAVIE